MTGRIRTLLHPRDKQNEKRKRTRELLLLSPLLRRPTPVLIENGGGVGFGFPPSESTKCVCLLMAWTDGEGQHVQNQVERQKEMM
jgi:hypothetical protein